MLAYEDTRGLDPRRPAFTDVILKGIAEGGGLYVPVEIPRLPHGWVRHWTSKAYPARALAVLELFDVDLPHDVLEAAAHAAYGANFDDPKVAPVREIAPSRFLLELFHGPTCAFKDMALQLKPVLFSEAVRAKRAAGADPIDYLILVATSGDTGKAALEGYRDREFVSIIVFYPAGGVSYLQERQMLTQEGANVAVFGVTGDFDDCQAAVKAVMADPGFEARLGECGLALSSANSINWGRVLPQIAYYASAYADLVTAGAVAAGDPIDVCVPTGNFGNILAAYYAKRIGVPIARLLCASNENKVLTDFLATGVYDLTGRELVKTPSPSMDILVSSNLERLLFAAVGAGSQAVSGARAAAVRGWMEQLRTQRRFEVDAATMAHIRDVFVGDWVTNEQSLATIRDVFVEHRYLLDPHTAVAWHVADRLAADRPVLVVATAHWAKFGADVFRALWGIPAGGPLPDRPELAGTAILTEVLRLAPGQAIPAPLSGLDTKPVRFEEVVARDPASVRGAIERSIAAWERKRG